MMLLLLMMDDGEALKDAIPWKMTLSTGYWLLVLRNTLFDLVPTSYQHFPLMDAIATKNYRFSQARKHLVLSRLSK
jgi:hypothetical protein